MKHENTAERATLLVLANQTMALMRWIEHTVPEWTTEVQLCMNDCQKTCNLVLDYLDGKIDSPTPKGRR